MAKILLVEDDKSLREIYGVRLMAEGYEIISAGDGEEALAIAIKERPDLIVSDVMMPKISGFDMLDILRSTSETKAIKVIMMTALSSEDQRARGESLGADRYLVKSQVGIEDVVRTVHEVLGDGVQGASPTAPSPFTSPAPKPAASTPAPASPTVTPTIPAEPALAASTPIATTAEPAAPIPPRPTPVLDTPAPAPANQPPVINTPPVAPAAPAPPASPTPPIVEPTVVEPVLPTPTMDPVPAANPGPTPVTPAPATLPEPTAPFSSPAPASLGDRIINPITPPDTTTNDIAAQMTQELNASAPTAHAPTPPVPPAPGAAL